MNKNRSTWASLLSLVLALVVMAGLAVTAFAVTDGGAGNESAPVVDSVDELAAVLDGTQDPEPNVNYDVDGNGIVERDDLTVLKHQKDEGDPLPDLLPSGGNDWLGTLDDGTEDYAFFQSAIVRGDSTKAIHVSAKSADLLGEGMEGYAALSYYSAPIDFTGYAALTFDTFWPNGAGSVTVTLYDVNMAYEPYAVTVNATNAGWSTVIIGLEDIPAEFLASVASVDFMWDGEHEVYIDNLQLAEANVTYSVGANGVTKLFDKFVIAGQPYGELPTPVRPFHIFAGWYADAEYENAVTADTIVAAGDSYTLYAKWEKDESIDTPMSEGGDNAILSVVEGKEDTYLYSVETPAKYEERYLNIDILDATASVISIDFTFHSANRATIVGGTIEDGKLVNGEISIGEAITPALYITDRQDSNGVFGAYYVVVNKQTGEPAATLELDTEYTVYITLKAGYHKSVKIAPMGNVNTGTYTDNSNPQNVKSISYVPYVYSMEVSAPVEHHDAPSMGVYMVPSSGNHAMMSLYKKADNGEWLYGYIADNALPKLAYADVADRDLDDNTAYYRRIHVYTGAATTEVRFDFCYHTALNGDDTLVAFGLNNGGTVTIQNVDGTALDGTPAVGRWYTAIINKDGASLGTTFDVYTLGNNIDGTDTNYVQVELCIKNLRAKLAIAADDGSVTMNGGLYNANDRDNAITILHEDVQPLAVSISKAGAKQMRFKFKLTDDTNFAISYGDGADGNGDGIDYNNPNIVIVDEASNAVKAANVVAGKWYTAIVYAEIERYTNSSGTFWSSGEMCKTGTLTITTAGDLQIKEAEALSGLFGFRLSGIAIEMTRLDLSTLDYPGCEDYKYGYSINVNEASKYDTRMEFLNQRGLYNQLTFDFCITDFNGNTTAGADAELWFEGLNTTIYDQAGNALASHKDMVIGTWYTVKCDIADVSGGEYAVSLYSFGEDNATRLPYKAYLANINWTAADVMFDHDYAVKTATLERSGNDGLFQVDRVTKYDGRATYEVTASSANWSDRALKLSLLDSDKDFIQLDFCYTVSRNADGKHVAPSMNVYTNLSGTPKAAQYVIVDANDNPVTELVTGNWYRMFITANGNTQFAIVPETEGWVRVQFNELETFAADEMNVAVTSDDPMNVSSSLLLDRFGDMRYGYANYAGNTGVLTFTPNASTYKQIRFNFLLKEVGTPAMSVNNGTISITDASGEAVDVADLTVDTWYTAAITNSGNAISSAVKLTVGSGNTRMVIKDLKAYDTTNAPAAGTVHSIFHGLEDGEMMIAGFLGPREEYYNVHGVAKAPMIRDEIFKLLAESGINYIDDNSFSYSGTQLEVAQDVLRLASKYNLNYFIGATDIANIGAIANSSVNAAGNTVYTYSNHVALYATFAAKLDELTQYKSFGGLHLRDEPSADLFLKIGEALKHIEDYNTANGTKLEGFVNLLPGVGTHRWTNGQTIKDASGNTVTINTWSDYVRAYAKLADPNFLSFDMYPIQGEAGQIEYAYFNFLGYFSTVAKEKNLPMAVCIQVGGGEPSLPNKRQANTDEMHWNVNSSLAFGAEAMTYFIMVEPPYYGDEVTSETLNSHTAINVNGEPTPYYDAIKAINTNVKAVDHVIVNGTHKGVIFNGTMPNTVAPETTTEITAPYDGTQLTKSEAKLTGITGNALIGVYDYEGKTALYVVNNSITSANTIGLTFTGNYTYEIISEGKTSWATGSSLSLNLAIGRAAMVIVHTSTVSTDVTVAFELNYETTTPNPAGKLLTTGNAYGELPTPVRPFYTFDGWYMNAECTGDEVTSTTTMTAMGDHALYAKWVEADLAITQTNVNHSTLTAGDELGTYVYTSNVAGTTSPDSRSLQLKVNVADKEVVKFKFKFTTSLAADGSDLTPDMYVGDVYNGYWRRAESAITDENGKPVANLVAGEWYTMWITTEGQTSFRIFPMGQIMSQQVNAEMLIKDLEAVDVEIGSYFVSNDGGTFGPVGLYQDASGNWGYFTSAYDRYSAWLYEGTPKNLADYRKIRLKLDASDYTMATFQFQYQVSHYMAEGSTEWVDNLNLLSGTSNHTITVYDADGNEVAAANRKIGQWYTAVVKNTAGNVADTVVMYTCGYSGTNDKQVVEMEMLVKNIQGYKATTQPVYNNADNSVSVESAGIIDVLTQDGNNIRYQLTADKIPYLSGANAVRVKLLDTTKQVISMKFTVNTLTDASGAASTPWTRVVTGSGNEANYAVIDEDGNLVKNIAAGKTYTLFITSPEFATNLYSKPSVPTEFVVYPVGMDTQSVADITFTEIAAHAVSGFSSNEGAITHTTTMVHNNLSYYKVGDQWNFSFSASETLFRGNTTAVSTAFTPAASATTLTLPSGSIKAVSMRVRYVEGMNNGAERYAMAASCTITFYDDNGNVVAAADRKAGQWYNVSLTNVSGNTVTIYPAGHDLVNAAIMLQVADITVMAEDTNPVTIASTETSWVTLTYELVNGSPAYTFNSTAYAAANSSSAWQRCLTLTNPLDKAAVLTMDFKFLSNTDGDGNAIRASVIGNTPKIAITNYAIVEKDTGKLVGKCEMGKEYTLFVSADAGATVRVHIDAGHVGTTSFQMVITDRAALEAPAAGDVTLTANSLDYGNLATYYVDGEWRYGFTTYTGIQSTGASGHYYRRLFMKQAADTYSQVSFEFKYDVAQKVATDGTVTEITDDLMLSGAKYYTMDGVQVTDRTFTVGQWYKVVVTSDTTLGASLDVFPLREQNRVADSYELEITTAFRNFVALEKDTNPVVVEYNNTYNSSNAINTVDIVDGKHVYTYTTRDVAIPTNSPYGRRLNISVPADITYLSIEFRFTEAYKADGITEFAPSLGVYLNASSGLGVPKIYDSNGKLVASGNATTGLVIDEWYTVIINPGGATSFGLWPAHNYTDDAAILTMEIRDRSTYTAGESLATFSTPAGNFPEPNVTYYNGEWVQVISGNSATSATQENKRLAVTMTNAGAGKLRFEMMMKNASGTAIPHMYGASGLKIYNLDGTALASNNTALDSGVWYIFEYETGANLGTDIIYLGYLGGGGNVGGLDAFIRNVQITEIGSVTVNFNGNYDGAETFDSVTVEQGATYGTLPTPAEREGYTFAGWYTNAACTGSAVTEDTTVSASHTLYAKWEIVPDTNTVVVGSVTNGYKSVDYVDGKHVYTYTTRGVENPGTGTLARTVGISFPAGQTHVAVDFRFKESFESDGTTKLAPYLGVYWAGSGNSSSTSGPIHTIWIYDANGNQVSKNNDKAALNVDQWYTLIVQVNTTSNLTLCPIHHYSGEGAPVLTMEIRDRGCQAEPGTWTAATSEGMVAPVLRFVDGGFRWDVLAEDVNIAAWSRRLIMTLKQDGMQYVGFEFMTTGANGAAVNGITSAAASGTLTCYDLETGALVTSFEEGKWYGASYSNTTNLGTEAFRLIYPGGSSSTAGGVNIYLRNLKAYAADSSTVTPTAAETSWGTLYRTGESTYQWANKIVSGSESSTYQRGTDFVNPLDTTAVIKVNFKYLASYNADGSDVVPSTYMYYWPSGGSMTNFGQYIVTDPETGEVVGDMVVGKPYTVYMTLDAGIRARLCYGAGAASGYRGSVELWGVEVLTPEMPGITVTPNAANYSNTGLYQSGDEWIYGYNHRTGVHSASADLRKFKITLDSSAYTQLSFQFMFDEKTNNGTEYNSFTVCALNSYTGLPLTIKDSSGTTVTVSELVSGNWYTATVTNTDGAVLPNLHVFFGMGGGGSATEPYRFRVRIKNLQGS